jgi:hypothetical protein
VLDGESVAEGMGLGTGKMGKKEGRFAGFGPPGDKKMRLLQCHFCKIM